MRLAGLTWGGKLAGEAFVDPRFCLAARLLICMVDTVGEMSRYGDGRQGERDIHHTQCAMPLSRNARRHDIRWKEVVLAPQS